MKQLIARPSPALLIAICLLSAPMAAPAWGSDSPPNSAPPNSAPPNSSPLVSALPNADEDPIFSAFPQFSLPDPLAMSSASTSPSGGLGGSANDSFANMSLEQLMQVEVTTDTLTQTQRNLVPAAVTTIDQSEIQQQNPRSFTELLDIYVPDFETADQAWEMPTSGMRGIIGDNNTKLLYLVNGREMNELTHFGVLTEQDLPLMGDIGQVDVVRGPGSATYGPGAVAGVISVTTLNGLTYQGTDVQSEIGGIDEYYTFEFKHGEKLTEDSGWFVYGGVAQMTGAPENDAPIVGGQNYTTIYGTQVQAGQPIEGVPLAREDAEFNGEPDMKFHLEYDNGGLSIWARYSKGGLTLNQVDRIYGDYPTGFSLAALPVSVEYDQLTSYVGDKVNLTDNLSVNAYTSFDFTDYRRIDWHPDTIGDDQEQKSISQAQVNWDPFKGNQLAAGTEFGYYWLGLPSWFTPNSPPVLQSFTTPETWTSYMLSFFAEDQWQIIPKLTLFLSGRADKDRFTDWLFSPRAALVWAPEDHDTLKFIYSQSLRTNTEEYMYANYLSTGKNSPAENMTNYEIRWERQQTQHLFFGTSVFYDDLGVIGWNNNLGEQEYLGTYKTAGIELEASYRTPDDTITLSHSYTKLVGQNFIPNSGTFITSAPFGYGYDLANWSNNVTKLTFHHKFSDQFSADANLQVLWGFSGSQEYQDYRNSIPYFGAGTPTDTVANYTQPYGTTAYLNLGVEYNINEHATVRFDAYNVLGWIDQTLNKDDTLGGLWTGEYRVEAPAYALTFRYSF